MKLFLAAENIGGEGGSGERAMTKRSSVFFVLFFFWGGNRVTPSVAAPGDTGD